MREKFNKCYKASLEVINLYDKLNDILIDNNAKFENYIYILNKIKKAIIIEDNIYNKLEINEIKEFINKIEFNSLIRDYTYTDIRICSKLAYMSDILTGQSINNNGLFTELEDDFKISISDLINTKIALDLYKLIRTKIDSLSLNDKKSLLIAKKLKEEDVQQFIYKISLRVLGEKLAINHLFDIYKIKDIDFSIIESKILDIFNIDINISNIINKKIYTNIIETIDILQTLTINPDDYNKIYDNLVYTSQIEVLIKYLNKKQLEELLIYCNQINTSNKLVIGNVKKILTNKLSNI